MSYNGLTPETQCGGIMFSEPEKAPVLFLKVGLIDDQDFLRGLSAPKMEIYCKYLLPWEKTFEGAKLEQS